MLFIAFIALIFIYGLFSSHLERTVLTGPVLFAVAGLVASRFVPDSPAREAALKLFLGLAEMGLVLLLFTDASRVERRVLRSIRNLPVRLLSSGMLLTIVLGALAALLVFRQLTIREAGILPAILAPTDAGLGQVIVTRPLVPLRIRRALNVEAGLDDGLSVPFMLFFIALAAGGAAGGHSVEFTDQWGQPLNLSLFFLFGLHFARAWPLFAPAHWLFAVLSLTVVRMLPVTVALAGAKLTRATVLFMGWFGPRGLASIVLGLVYLEKEMHLPGEDTIRLTVMATVMLSILVHGLSGLPGSNGYAAKVEALPEGAPERQALATETAD